jgi:maleylpyruvate isomerase
MRELEMALAGCTEAHRGLLASLDGLTDEVAAGPSLLPGWSVGHVLTHIARNADSFVRLTAAAVDGRVVPQYEGGMPSRNAEIEAGAGRSAVALVADVRESAAALDACWASAPESVWAFTGETALGPALLSELPVRRWREVTVHRSDLGLGSTPADWPNTYVRIDLPRLTMLWASRRPMGLTTLPPEALAATPQARLAWLLGRASIDGLGPAGVL